MKKNLLTVGLLALSLSFNAQILTYVGKGALVTVTDQALVYSGGGVQLAAGTATTDKGGVVNNMGDIMVVDGGAGTDKFQIDNFADFRLQFDEADTSKKTYGQLYISGIPQGGITGVVNKDFIADANHGITGRQQTALPFYNYSINQLNTVFGGNLQITNTTLNSTGRFNFASVFRWNNQKARFDQLTTSNSSTSVGAPTDYYIIPRRNNDGTVFWNAAVDKKTFSGTPVSDVSRQTQITLAVPDMNYITSFGVNGNTKNYYYERYNSYLNDPFRVGGGGGVPAWDADYGQNLSQFGNPFLTNIDLNNIIGTSDADGDGNALSNVEGIAYYGDNDLNWYYANQSSGGYTGTVYTNGNLVIAKSTAKGTPLQAGDVTKMIIKPMQEVMVKLTNSTPTTLNLNGTRRFAQTPRTVSYSGVTTARTATVSSIPADQLVKQVAAVLYNASGSEVGRTYYAVSPSAVTGASPTAKLQGYVNGYAIYTKEEAISGGADANSTQQLYINEANEVSYVGKEIPLVVDFSDAAKIKFEIYEGGQPVSSLSNGKSFYVKNDKVITKINNGDTIPVVGTDFGLFYEQPESVLSDTTFSKNQTVIAKKGNDWVVRFADSWKSASVEVYSASGQLIHSNQNVSASADYIIPINSRANGLFIVKATSESGEVVTKKIVK